MDNRKSKTDRIDDGILELRVSSTRVDELRFRMDPPLTLAGRSIQTREYVVLQITLENGMTGTAYVLTRGQPIGKAAEILAQKALGKNVAGLFSSDDRDRGTSPDQRSRALLDNCAWDLAGLVPQVPTWALLGQAQPHQPALLVAGYRRQGENNQEMARRLVGWRDRGYRSIKIAANLDDDGTTELLAQIRELASVDDLDLILDLGFAGRDVTQIIEAAQAWQPYGITWLEDPVNAAAAAEIAAMRTAVTLPVAAGDEASPAQLLDLLNHSAVDILRADTTTVGGLTGLVDIVDDAAVPVSLHIYPEIHRHAAFVMDSTSPIETFPAGDCFDFVDRFIHADDMKIDDGRFLRPESPGFGLHYRPEAVKDNIIRSSSFVLPNHKD